MFLLIQLEEFQATTLVFFNGSQGSIFFMLTGFHGLHVIIGMFFLVTVLYRLWGPILFNQTCTRDWREVSKRQVFFFKLRPLTFYQTVLFSVLRGSVCLPFYMLNNLLEILTFLGKAPRLTAVTVPSVFFPLFDKSHLTLPICFEKSILFDISVWYWHFVDYVWIFVYILLYIVLN